MKRIYLFLLAMVMLVSFTGCPFVQIDPNNQVAKYETFGRNLGTYAKNKNPEFVAEANTYVKGILELSDEELISADVLQTAYDYAMKNYPKNMDLIFLIKSGIDLYGIKIDVSKILPDERPEYVRSIRALVKGYYEASKVEL